MFDDILVIGDVFDAVEGESYENDIFWYSPLPIPEEYSDLLTDMSLQSAVNSNIANMYGERELALSDRFWKKNFNHIDDDDFVKNYVVPYIQGVSNSVWIKELPNWARIYDALKEEYNPLWNVDATENFLYTKDNTGSQTYAKKGTDTDNVAFVGSESNVNTKQGSITEHFTPTGSETERTEKHGSEMKQLQKQGVEDTLYSGSESNVKTGSEATQNARTAYDTNVAHATDSSTDTYNGVTDTKEFNNRKDTLMFSGRVDNENTRYGVYADNGFPTDPRYDEVTKSFTSREDVKQTNFSENNPLREEDVKSFTNRADNRTLSYNNKNIRKDSLKEIYDETKTRGGNIGVTKSQELLEAEVDVRLRLNMCDIISRAIVNAVSYMC